MTNYSKEFTVVINCQSGDPTVFLNCLSSLYDLEGSPSRVIGVFNPFYRELSSLFDIEEFRHIDLIKNNIPIYNHLIYNNILEHSTTDFNIIVEDDIVFREPNLYKILTDTHDTLLKKEKSIFRIRFSEGLSAVSYCITSEINDFAPFHQIDPYLAYHTRKNKSKLNGNV